ncbi:hypothetical protein WMF20_37695 [Sorangium sp. So ce834]|uniref:hypothetical protein n=1 Tax=Sorangium sp. So ce834 TaxID=3133321 RepID=UPI003F60F1B1
MDLRASLHPSRPARDASQHVGDLLERAVHRLRAQRRLEPRDRRGARARRAHVARSAFASRAPRDPIRAHLADLDDRRAPGERDVDLLPSGRPQPSREPARPTVG